MSDRERQSGVGPVEILLVTADPGAAGLTREGFVGGRILNTFHVVGDAIEALAFLRRRNEYADAPDVDLVLVDLDLPRASVEAFLAQRTADPPIGRIPVFVLSGSDDRCADRRCTDRRLTDRGVDGSLAKPVDPDAFFDAVRSIDDYWLSIVRSPAITETE